MRQLSPSTRDAIVTGTTRLLSMKEFAEVTTRAIAESAEISEATLFRYFPRKEDILGSILLNAAKGFFEEIETVVSLVDGPAEKLLALCRAHARFGARNRPIFAIMQRECSYLGKKDPVCTEGLQCYLAKLGELLQNGMRAGVFRRDLDVEIATLAFQGVIHNVMMEERLLQKKPYENEEFVSRAERFYQHHLRAIRAEHGKSEGRGR